METISVSLQQELPGLRGFSVSNLKNMRGFYEAWNHFVDYQSEVYLTGKSMTNSSTFDVFRADANRQAVTDEIDIHILVRNRQAVTGEITAANRQAMSDNLQGVDFDYFLSIGFTHHNEILSKAKVLSERLFYIERCATEFWSYRTLQCH